MDNVRPAVSTVHHVLTNNNNNNKMIKIQLIVLTLIKHLTARADNNFQFLNFDFYEDDDVLSRTNDNDNDGGFIKFLENSGSFNGSFIERTNRRNEYVPFNSLTLGGGKEAGASPTLSSKFKLKNKDKIKNRNKVEWWTKKKNKKNKKKSPQKSSNQKVRPTTTTARTSEATTKKLTTWFPSRQTTTSSYFSRPLDYQRPLNPSTKQTQKVFLDTLGTEHQYLI